MTKRWGSRGVKENRIRRKKKKEDEIKKITNIELANRKCRPKKIW